MQNQPAICNLPAARIRHLREAVGGIRHLKLNIFQNGFAEPPNPLASRQIAAVPNQTHSSALTHQSRLKNALYASPKHAWTGRNEQALSMTRHLG